MQEEEERVTDSPFVLRGDHLALDFVNTEIRNASGGISDLLTDTAALLDWLRLMNIFREKQESEVTPGLLETVRGLRAALRAILTAHVENTAYPAGAIAEVNTILRSGIGYSRLETENGQLVTRYQSADSTPLRLLFPIAEAAATLLTGEQAEFVRRCENPQCILYFLDTSKNHRRRWCSMSACGNRHKAAAHYRRLRGNPALEQ